MIKEIGRRFLSLVIVMVLLLGLFPDVYAEEQVQNPTETDERSEIIIVGDSADPLQSVATVTTGGDVSSYVDIDSTYTPSGYTTRSTGTSAYTSAPGNDFSYHTSRNGSTSNSYVITPTNDLSWSKNSGNTGVTGSLSSTAVSDNKACGENGALCAKVNSKVLKIYALEDINVTFDFSSNLTINNSYGQGNIMEGVYTLKTTSDAPTIAQIKAGTVRSNTQKTDLSKTVSATGSVSESIQQGEYLYIYFYSFFSNQSSADVDTTNYTYTASVTNFEITPVTQYYSLTVGNSDCADNPVGGGKITVNGTAVTIPASGTAAGLTDALGGTSVALSVSSVPSGYFHIGWRVNGTDYFQKTYDFSLNADTTAYALLIPQVTVTMGSSGYSDAAYSYKTYSGTTVNAADQYIARNSGGTAYYKTLNEAFSANNVVVLLGNIVLNGDFSIPANKTLSIQRGWGDPAEATLQQLAESTAISIFAKATINGTVTVQNNASLVASGVQGTNDGVNGRATGGVGQLIVNGTVNVASGGKLCAYGMITGPGHVNVASGGAVHELMEVRDMRSVYVLPTVASGGALMFNSYFLKTNEVATTYNQGATLTAHYYVSISGIKSGGSVTAIGPNNALFNISSGSLTKGFSSASPYNNKTFFRAENGSNIQSGKFSISVNASGFSETINTAEYDLPVNYCFAIEVMNGGSFTLNYDTKLLPGALVDVKEGGTLTIVNEKRLVLYRANDYGFKALSGFSAAAYPTAFTKPSGLSYASNTAANVGSAKLNVDGTLNVAGGLYVTNQLTGLTTYSNGYNYLTGTGTVNITGALSNGTIKEWTQSDSQNASSVTVAYVPIKGITNQDASTDDGQTDYNSFTKAKYYGYVNDSGVNFWSTSAPAVLSYDANGGTGEIASERKVGGSTFTAAQNSFTRDGYIFEGWNSKADGTGTSYAEGAQFTLTEDLTLYAQWAENHIHSWGTPSYVWSDDNSTVTATVVCTGDSNHVQTETAQASYVETTPASCTAEGSGTYTAIFTNSLFTIQTKTVAIPALGHNFGEWAVTTAPTCEHAGVETRSCSRCDATETREIAPLPHTPGEPVRENENPATCTVEGSYEEVTYCTVCHEELSRVAKTIEKLPHTPGEAVRENEVPATCTAEGSYEEVIYCTVCHEELSRETKTIEKLPHTPGEAVRENETPATCTAEGSYEEVIYCTVCGEELSRTPKTIEKLPHTPGEAVRENEIPATCTEAGSYESVVYCAVCDAELSRETVATPALGHDLIHHDAQAPTCTAVGWNAYDTCSRCDYTTYVELPATGHIPSAAVKENEVAATCTEAGSYETVVYCAVCDAELNRETVAIPALGHDLIHHDAQAPTCTAVGWNAYDTCSRCDYTTYVELPATGHTPAAAVKENEVAATCTEAGSYESVVYCAVCDAELSRETVATPALGHDLIHHDAKAPTCTAVGWNEYDTCSRCDYTTYEELPATGHNYGDPVWIWSEDLATAALRFTCANCGEYLTLDAVITETVLTEAKPHVAGEKKLTATVTFNETAYTNEKTVEIEALPCPCADFTDMPEYGTPEHEAIDWAFVNGITAGLSATEFGTNKTLNRAQAATFLYAAAGKPDVDTTATVTFNDVVPSNWYYKPVLWASANGMVAGYEDGTFKPNSTLTRAQILTILYAWAGRPDVSEYQNPYTDVRASNWYYAPAVWAYNAGIERGENGKFAQGTLCTRAAFVLYLYRHMTGNCLLED